MFTEPRLIEGNTPEPNSEDPAQENKKPTNAQDENCVDENELAGLKEKYNYLENNYNKFINKFDYTTQELELLLNQCLK